MWLGIGLGFANKTLGASRQCQCLRQAKLNEEEKNSQERNRPCRSPKSVGFDQSRESDRSPIRRHLKTSVLCVFFKASVFGITVLYKIYIFIQFPKI